ncbi:MAG: addiction module protein [Opitutales bacterium]
MILETIPQIGELSAEDRLRLASEIVEQVARERDDLPVAPEYLELLEASRREYQHHPERARSWEDVKQGLAERYLK